MMKSPTVGDATTFVMISNAKSGAAQNTLGGVIEERNERWTMAKEYIEREALLNRLAAVAEEQKWDNQSWQVLLAFKNFINNAPAANVAEVVRCKDCERMVEKDGMYVCNHALPTKSLTQYIEMGTDILAIVQPDDFCSYGERRNDD